MAKELDLVEIISPYQLNVTIRCVAQTERQFGAVAHNVFR